MKKIFFLLLVIISLNSAKAQEVKTLTYLQNDTLKLDLDLYLPKKKAGEKIPLIMFAFGGGFRVENAQAKKSLVCSWPETDMPLPVFHTVYT